MIRCLKELYEKIGEPPQTVDIDAASARGEMLPFAAYKRVFGNLLKALVAAVIHSSEPRRISRETMIEQLKALEKKLGRMPHSRDINRAALRGEIADPLVVRGKLLNFNLCRSLLYKYLEISWISKILLSEICV